MTRVIDLWRAVDPEARLGSGSVDALQRPVRAVLRTRTAAPHLPPAAEAHLLVADLSLLADGLDALFRALDEAGHAPSVIIAAPSEGGAIDRSSDPRPVLLSARPLADLTERATTYLADDRAALDRLSLGLRLACAEAALADPAPGAPAGLVAQRLRRGVAVTIDGQLAALHARPAGRALAARFAAAHARLLAPAAGGRNGALHRRSEGLWLLEHAVRPGTSVWLFDDLPMADADEVGAAALTVTMRALLRRGPSRPAPAGATRTRSTAAAPPADRFAATLLAVARANGRIAPAARELGVHRNTVRYRLRVASAERGLDPRRPDDALRILREAGADR